MLQTEHRLPPIEDTTAATQPQSTQPSEKLESGLPKRPTSIERFTAQLSDVEKATTKVMANEDMAPAERVQAMAKANREGLLKAAEFAGLGKFDSIDELHNHLLEKHNVLLVPSLDFQGPTPGVSIEVAKVKRVSLTDEEVSKELEAFTKATGIGSPGAQTIYIQEEMLYDQNEKRGMSANYGSSGALSGTESFILINRDLIKANEKLYEGTAADKERAVTVNELVTTAFNEQYPKLMNTPLKPLFSYSGQRISPIHVLELASDYASLSAGEDISDVIGRMSGGNPTYLLSNIVAAQTVISQVRDSEEHMKEVQGYMLEAVSLKKDPGSYAVDKFLKAHPELHQKLKTEMMSNMETLLASVKVVLDTAEAQTN